MSQYYRIVNLDKKQYLHPHKFGEGTKLLEFGPSGNGTMFGLAILLLSGNNKSTGDLRSEKPIIGSWAGDRIVIAGDYAEAYGFIPKNFRKKLYEQCLKEQLEVPSITKTQAKIYAKENCNIFNFACYFFQDISDQVIEALKNDAYFKEAIKKRDSWTNKTE